MPTPSSTSSPTSYESEAAVVADVARRAAEAGAITFEDVETGLVVRLHRHDEAIDVLDLERFLPDPRSVRGSANVTHPASFVGYVNRLADPRTTVWADQPGNRVTAVFNDHGGALAGGFRDHSAVFTPERDPDWLAWKERDRRLGTQESFAEFLEEHYGEIVRPDAATMLEIASTFQAKRSASFERATRLQSGDVQLRFSEETSATAGSKGHIEVPTVFVVALTPYVGVDPVEVTARLRYRIKEGGQLGIGYAFHRPEEIERKAFEDLVTLVRSGLREEIPVLYGPAPRALLNR